MINKSLLAIGVLTLVVRCSSPVPVQELSDARNEISYAEEEHAADCNAASLQSAKDAILEAHKKVSESMYPDAKGKAEDSFKSARGVRLQCTPAYADKTKADAGASLTAAEEAYAEELAKDDFAAAKKLYGEGDSVLTQAKGGSGDTGLPMYRQAYRKFEASKEASEKAKNSALAQKTDMLNSLAGIQTVLEKAEKYGASEYAPSELDRGKTALAGARADLEADKIKPGTVKMKEAEEQAGMALQKSMSHYADKRKQEATVAVTQAERTLSKIPLNEKSKTLHDYGSAAREALNSATSNYSVQKYEESIKDSDEAIRLASIINDQNGGSDNRDMNMGSLKNLPKGWQVYKVQSMKPNDCLSCIAGRKPIYGDIHKWDRIYKANKDIIKNPNLVYPGQTLFVPPATGEIPSLNRAEILKEGGTTTVPQKVETTKPEMKTETQPQENMK